MRSVKGIIIGFLLILLGFALSSFQLVAGLALSACGLGVVIVCALPKRARAPQPQEAAPSQPLSPQSLPDILTDAPKPPAPPQPPAPPEDGEGAAALYQTLGEAYTRLDALSCRGPAWSLERDVRLCRVFTERWRGAQSSAAFQALLEQKLHYSDFADEFLLPSFGKRGRIPGRRISGSLRADLSTALLARAHEQEQQLQAALQTQQWFEKQLRRLRSVMLTPLPEAAHNALCQTLPQPQPLTRQTDAERFETFFVLAERPSVEKKDQTALAVLKFQQFAPTQLAVCTLEPTNEDGLCAALTRLLGQRAPLVVFSMQTLARLRRCQSVCDTRTVYAVQTLLARKSDSPATLADACGLIFTAPPTPSDVQADALACGLIFCELCDRTLRLTK